MPILSDYVLKGCVANNKSCSLSNKCVKCKKEMDDLKEIDKMFKDIISDIATLRQSEKNISPDRIEKNDPTPK